MVNKPSGGLTDLNKACPKDSYPLPNIDRLIESTAGNEMLTFMDAFSGYNQIMMHPDDREKMAFITDRRTYCYKVMPFGLKNAGATYQRLVNRMFTDKLGDTMEVYIDDMLVKSLHAADHLLHPRDCFETLLGSKTVTTKLMSKSPKKKNVENFFDKYFFEIDSSLRKNLRIIGQELEKDRYAATKHVLRSVAT